MKLHSIEGLRRVADSDTGVCLHCGEVQEFLEERLRLGLCECWGEQRVMPTEDALALVEWIEGEEE